MVKFVLLPTSVQFEPSGDSYPENEFAGADQLHPPRRRVLTARRAHAGAAVGGAPLERHALGG